MEFSEKDLRDLVLADRANAGEIPPVVNASSDDSSFAPADNYPSGCPVCRGVGFVFDETTWERNGFRGGLIPCPACGQARRQKQLERFCGLSESMRRWTLERFREEFGRNDALKAARRVVEKPQGFLAFWGAWGTGKTYLLASIVNESRERGRSAIYTTVANLLDNLRAGFDPESAEDFSVLWNRIQSAQVLALDEVEKFRASEWAEEKFFQLIEQRYNAAESCLTVFATNRPIKPGVNIIETTRYPGYLESRLADGRFEIVELRNGDLRPLLHVSDAGPSPRPSKARLKVV